MKKVLGMAVLAALIGFAVAAQARDNNQGYGAYGGNQQPSYGTPAPVYGGYNNDHAVSGHTRSDGTYVQPHRATNPNSTRNDNYSTQGNTNPYTGQPGTKPRSPW